MNEEKHQSDDDHFQLPLPLKKNTVLPNNKTMALKRLNGLKRKLCKSEQYQNDYKTFMNNLMEQNFAEKIPSEELHGEEGCVWYIPHHGVYHPKKPNKIRVVFDCSAEYEGHMLNKQLLPGPDMTNNLT